MKSVDFLINSLEILHDKFSSCNIRYQFIANTSTHLVEVTPMEFYNDEDYMNEELLLEDTFIDLYPAEQIVFISEDSLNKISNPDFELYSEKEGEFIAEFEVASNDLIDFEECVTEVYQYEIDNNYALAA